MNLDNVAGQEERKGYEAEARMFTDLIDSRKYKEARDMLTKLGSDFKGYVQRHHDMYFRELKFSGI